MAVPDFQTLMLPTLLILSNEKVWSTKEVIEATVREFKLSDEDRAQMLPSGAQRVIDNRVYWALIYLQRAQLVNRPERGRYQISSLGKEILQRSPERIDIKFLRQFESFRQFQALGKSKNRMEAETEGTGASSIDPREALEQNYERLRASTCAEILERLRGIDPTTFEKLVVQLLKTMGYGVPGLESVLHSGRPGDGGVDGEISQDPLGLDMVYVQVKRYQEGQGVGRPAVQQFVGSLNERKARKGVFITTSHFSDDAREYVNRIDVKIVLIDGEELARLMFEYNLGVAVDQKYELKKVDPDYFEAA